MKKIPMILAMVLVLSLLAGCAGTPVVYNCTCPTGGETTPAATQAPAASEAPAAPTAPAVEGAVKTGLHIATSISGSAAATAEAPGKAEYDVTMVAVTVDDNGVIQQCLLDGVKTAVNFDAAGVITTDVNAEILTKNELGENYGMVAYGGAVAEWDQQAAALAAFAVGKTVEELKSGAVSESGYAPEGSDLASSATIYLGGYVSAIEAAVNKAQHLGAQAGDELKLAAVSSVGKSTAATAEAAGNAQLDTTVTAVTVNDGTITSCAIDSVQAKVGFDAAGALAGDVSAPVPSKNELGEAYGMKAWGGAVAEWDQQAASFAAYVTGKTVDQVLGIAVNEKTAPTEADLASSVTISIGEFQNLIAKAVNG